MRLSACLLLLASPALADTFEAPGPVTAVTLYPDGATVTRSVTFAAPAGAHELVIPGLPSGMAAEGLRVAVPGGVEIGAISLARARPPASSGEKPAAVVAAEAEVRRLEAVLRDGQTRVAAIRARGEAALARAAFLQSLAQVQGEGKLSATGIEDLRALSALVGDEVLAARAAELEAEAAAATAELALEPDRAALDRARAALSALVAPDEGDAQVLTLTLQTASDGPVTLSVDSLGNDAGWVPVYDLRLGRNPDTLVAERGAVVTQNTGEDWRGVALTLSTARPSEQAEPSSLWPLLRQIEPEDAIPPPAPMAEGGVATAEMAMEAPVVVEQMASGFDAAMLGQVFTYRFAAPVDIRTDADEVRLVMDKLAPEVKITAEAVPLRDATAFLVAEITNTTGQPFLPGFAVLYAEGALVGATDLPLIATGGKAKVGFGAIDGLRLTRIVPGRSAGEEGFFTSANRIAESAILTVENLTGEAWPLRVTDQVPYSEQDDLKVTATATPPATETDPEGARGLMVWMFDLPPGARQEIRIETRLDWPTGMVLR